MRIRHTLISLALAAAAASTAHAADGDLASGWGLFGAGRNVVAFDAGPSQTDLGADAVAGPDGSFYLAATVTDADGKQRIGVSKLNPSGVLDLSFSGDGKNLSIKTDVVATGIALNITDNSILVSGYSTANSPDTDMVVCRFFLSNGANRNFPAPINDPCVTVEDFPGSQDYARDIVVQADGKFVVAGTMAPGATNARYAAFARFNADGSRDTNFGTLQGSNIALIRRENIFTNHDLRAVAIASNGKIVGVGSTTVVGSTDLSGLVVRLNTDGTQDALAPTQEYSFSIDGSANLDTVVRDVVLVDTNDAEDDAYVAGYVDVTVSRKGGALAKLVRGNVLTNDFGAANEGFVINSIANASLEFTKLMRRPGGEGFLTVGLRNDQDIGDFDVRSFSSDGRLSNAFGTAGVATVDFLLAGAIDIPVAIGFGGGGILLGGYSYVSGSNYDVVAAKLEWDRIFSDSFSAP